MKESDYIVATNLARVRMIKQILSDLTIQAPISEEDRREMMIKASEWEEKLAKKV